MIDFSVVLNVVVYLIVGIKRKGIVIRDVLQMESMFYKSSPVHVLSRRNTTGLKIRVD